MPNLTEKVRTKIVQDILSGTVNPGSKIPPEREMAELTGTSRVTVRRAYRQLEKNRIIERRAGAGTRVVETFSGNSDPIEYIAILTTLKDPFARDFIEAVQVTCNENDIFTILAVTEEDTCKQVEMAVKMVSRGIKNIIVWGFDRSLDLDTFARIRILGVNMVFFDRVAPGDFADFVLLDNQDAMSKIFDAASGNADREFIFADSPDLDVDSNKERRHAFIMECEKRNLRHRILNVPWRLTDEKALAEITDGFFNGTPCVLVALNDVIALRIKPFLANTQIFSIDGTPEALEAGIRSYSQPIGEMATATVNALKRQRQLGPKWKAKQYRVKGSLS